MKKSSLYFLPLAILCFLFTSLNAQTTYTFIAGPFAIWSDPMNWDAANYPGTTINAGDEVIIAAGAYAAVFSSPITNNGLITVNGTFEPVANLINNSDVTISETGTLIDGSGGSDNLGTITNNGSYNTQGFATNVNTAIINNNGMMLVDNNSNFTNNGAITNSSSGVLTNGESGTFTNKISIVNNGSIINNGIFNNGELGLLTPTITNNDMLKNNKQMFNFGILDNFGTINNDQIAGSPLFNSFGTSGTLTNHVAGIINNTGIFTISGLFNNDNIFNNNLPSGSFNTANDGSTINNVGTINLISGTDGSDNAGAEFVDDFTNAGIINVTGYMANEEILTNNGTINIMASGTYSSFFGAINNNTLTNAGTISAFSFANTAGAILTNNNAMTTPLTNDGTFKGNGTLVGNVTGLTSTGNTAPGNSVGTIAITGNLELTAGTYSVELDGMAQTADLLTATGTIMISNTLDVSLLNIPGVSATYTIMSAVGGITGTFDMEVLPMVTGSSFAIVYTATEVQLVVSTALPVELVSFKAKALNQQVELSWRTASEINNEGYYVERNSTLNTSWTDIGFVRGNGSTTITQDYSLIDQNPNKGISYYRLRQMDFDGKFEYSKVVAVDLSRLNLNPIIYPNPIIAGSSNLNIVLNGSADLIIFDVQGKQVYQRKVLAPDNSALSIKLPHLNVGIYMVQMIENGKVFIEKLIVQ